jgi:cysteine synthase
MSSELVKANPATMTILQAHITEHVGFMARMIVQEEMAEEMQQLMQQTGGQLTPEQQQQIEQRTESGVAIKIAEIIEQMVAEEQEMMDMGSNDPLVDLKQQEINLRKDDLELKAVAMGEKQALDEKKLEQTDRLTREKIESQEDIAQLRANVALDKADKDRSAKKTRS